MAGCTMPVLMVLLMFLTATEARTLEGVGEKGKLPVSKSIPNAALASQRQWLSHLPC
jgi:hypothetical protein